jgi:hypothetical protein
VYSDQALLHLPPVHYCGWTRSFDQWTGVMVHWPCRDVEGVAHLILLRRLFSASNIPVLYSLGIKDVFTTSSSLNCHGIRGTVVVTPKTSNLERLGQSLNNSDLRFALRTNLLGLPYSR